MASGARAVALLARGYLFEHEPEKLAEIGQLVVYSSYLPLYFFVRV
jgi:hypothetical protein